MQNPLLYVRRCKTLPGSDSIYYKQSWAALFLKGCSGRTLVDGITGADNEHKRECDECVASRQRRCRVLSCQPEDHANLHAEPFVSAPAIFSYNAVNYFALHLRAEEFAKTHGRTILWMVARDIPLFHQDRS